MRTRRVGFTLIELMVVIAIIIMAAGLMVPSLADFFRNRALDGVRAQITASFNSARLQAVAQNRQFAVVFFQEGVRVYDLRNHTWMDGDEFNPKTAFAADEELQFELVFANMQSNPTRLGESEPPCLPRYEDWWDVARKARGGMRDEDILAAEDGAIRTFSIDGLVRVLFQRDGVLRADVPGNVYVYKSEDEPIVRVFRNKKGSDVPAAFYKKSPPENADVIITQRGNDQGCFIDLQMTGAVRSKVDSVARIMEQRALQRERS